MALTKTKIRSQTLQPPTLKPSAEGLHDFIYTLKARGFEGEADIRPDTLDKYSHDASLFELRPQMVVYPKNVKDLQRLVVSSYFSRPKLPNLSLTARAAGTDMGGGSINESVIIDFTHYFNYIGKVTGSSASVQPGVLYRDFEKATLAQGALMPAFPASRELASVGGMVANFSGGELSLKYGKINNFVQKLQVVLSDGNVYELKALDRKELAAKRAQKNFEGEIYQQMYELLEKNYDKIKAAKPKVTKNSTGYNLWDVWDRDTGVFDLTKLFIGSQGTLGLISDINFKLVKKAPNSGVLVCFMKDRNMDRLGELINTVSASKPTSFEAFDNYTLMLAIKFFPYFSKTIGWKGLFKLGLQLLPDALILAKGIPKMVLLIEYTGDTAAEVTEKVHAMRQQLEPFNLDAMEEDETEAKAWKFRIMRRESFNLLRKKVHDKHTAPFIDDFVVPPEHLPEFLPKLRKIVKKYSLMATLAGHMGDGNFHVIPLMKIEDRRERAKLEPAMKEVNELVLKYGGSISGEHNDGMIRGPWLEMMYGEEIVNLFRQTKKIFDPHNIFNPHKKTDADWDYSMSHIREHF
ncbi:MAG TPA: FAD-binding oxidoreductase [Candidatus Saccharimonadales bacterium]|nr:FAD-binding oxidoreductase [Candidatus Saccharimonadales bacterium]